MAPAATRFAASSIAHAHTHACAWGAHALHSCLQTMLEGESQCVERIGRDLPRTFRQHVLFKDAQSPGQQSLRNLLLVHTTPICPICPHARADDDSPHLPSALRTQMRADTVIDPKAYSVYNPTVGYCGGMMSIAAILLMHMHEEEVHHHTDHTRHTRHD